MMRCPDCHGSGGIMGLVCGEENGQRFSRFQQFPCPLCKSSGKITLEQDALRQAGHRLREERIGRRVTLREEAKRLGISPKELSDREWGRS